MRLDSLTPGARFRLPFCGKTGVVVSVGVGGTRVKYDAASRKVHIDQADGFVEFEAPGRPVLISSGTEVEAYYGPE